MAKFTQQDMQRLDQLDTAAVVSVGKNASWKTMSILYFGKPLIVDIAATAKAGFPFHLFLTEV